MTQRFGVKPSSNVTPDEGFTLKCVILLFQISLVPNIVQLTIDRQTDKQTDRRTDRGEQTTNWTGLIGL